MLRFADDIAIIAKNEKEPKNDFNNIGFGSSNGNGFTYEN